MFEEELLLFTTAARAALGTSTSYAINGGLPSPYFVYEGLKICPHYPLLKFGQIYLFNPLKPVLQNLHENVSFVDIADNNSVFIIYCDWCSMCNGIIHTAAQCIIENPEATKRLDFKKLKKIDRYLDFVLCHRTSRITNEEIEEWCAKIFDKLSIELLLLSHIYLKLERIELRWCPFKRSKEFYYRNKDSRYLEPTDKMIYEVGKILSKHETITCNNCPQVVNENLKYTKSKKPSVFQPLLEHMIKEINKCHPTCPQEKTMLHRVMSVARSCLQCARRCVRRARIQSV